MSASPHEGAMPSHIPVPFVQRRIANPLAARLGLTPTLVVRGRSSGHAIKVPIQPIELDEGRYLVANRGRSHWARNLLANPEAELHYRGDVERIRTVEVTGEERTQVLAAYRDRAQRSIKALLDKLPDPDDHPTFRIHTSHESWRNANNRNRRSRSRTGPLNRQGRKRRPRAGLGDSMIEASHLTKRYGETTAVEDLTFTVKPGTVTGFLGPNGSGKSTTMRMILGLDQPTAGTVTVNGRRYAEHRAPLAEVGALLEARAAHPGRSAQDHLLALAATHRISRGRVEEVIGLVGLEQVAGKRVGSFSLGMSQRLGIAAALLGDPATVVLDEPGNGLDPEGILWIRNMLKDLAHEGRTVLVSSHMMSEMAATADQVIVLGRGRVLADVSVAELMHTASGNTVRVRSAEADRLRELLARDRVAVTSPEQGTLLVRGASTEYVGTVARDSQIAVSELAAETVSLEEAYMKLTAGAAEYRTTSVSETREKVAA